MQIYYVLSLVTFSLMSALCKDKPPHEGNGNSSTDCLSDPHGFGCLDLTIPDFGWPDFSDQWPPGGYSDESESTASTLSPLPLEESTCTGEAMLCASAWQQCDSVHGIEHNSCKSMPPNTNIQRVGRRTEPDVGNNY